MKKKQHPLHASPMGEDAYLILAPADLAEAGMDAGDLSPRCLVSRHGMVALTEYDADAYIMAAEAAGIAIVPVWTNVNTQPDPLDAWYPVSKLDS